MDSPVRKMQKRNDYNRHKLFRKIRRRRRAQAEQLSRIAEKELKKKLRVTPVKYGKGKISGGANFDEDVVDWIIREEGFSPSPIDIGDGKTTLGSGLTDKKWIDQYNKSGKWTSEQNKRAVREEVANRRKWAESAIPNWDSLPTSSQKALLSYKYNFDFTPRNSPKLFKALSDSDLNEAARQINATSKNSKFKKGLEARRQREQQWFLQDVQKRPAIQPIDLNYYEQPVSTRVYNPHVVRETAPRVTPIMVPANGNYVETRRMTPAEAAKQSFDKRIENIQALERLAKAMSIIDNQRGLFDFLSSPFSNSPMSQRISGGYKDGKTTGYVRDKNDNPVAFDEEGNLVDQVTGEKGTIVLPELSIRPEKNILPVPSAATYSQWLKGTLSYLTGIKDKNLIESKYRPSQETDTETKYYTRKGLDYDVMKNLLGGIESDARTFDGENLYYKDFNDLYDKLSKKPQKTGRELRVTDNSQLGEYTIGIGQDAGGRYVSYYDKFDWAPKEELEIFFPYEIYNRIYEKDFDKMQRELSQEKYSGSNPSESWFFKSGIDNTGYNLGKTSSGIHIKPSHRGRLTALKKRTGKSEAELYRTGSAATRKMITFARNARKWKK